MAKCDVGYILRLLYEFAYCFVTCGFFNRLRCFAAVSFFFIGWSERGRFDQNGVSINDSDGTMAEYPGMGMMRLKRFLLAVCF